MAYGFGRDKIEDMLATATSALRDIHMDWPRGQIAAMDGSLGLGTLLREVVTELRGRGIDDEGGWNCAETREIPVADTGPESGRDIEMLAIAATALRDLHMDWNPREIVPLDGGRGGLPELVRGLVTELRGRGLDDEGGWDCPETVDIPVAPAPVMR